MHLRGPAAVRASSWPIAARIGTLLFAATLAFTVACSDSNDDGAPTLDDPAATGGELAERYLTLLQEKDADGLRDFLSDAFIIQRADGSHSEKAAYVENIPEIREFTISDVEARQAGDTLIVRWSLSVDEEINGQAFSGDPAPRLSTFVHEDGEWRLASHANFNVPDAPVQSSNQ